jgi:biotin operon repressor
MNLARRFGGTHWRELESAACMLTHPRDATEPNVVVDPAPAFEFLMTLATASETAELPTFEVGSGWLRTIERRAGPELLNRVRDFSNNSWFVWIELLPLAATVASPRDAASLIDHLRATDPRELCRQLAGYYDPDVRASVGPDLIDGAIRGDATSRTALMGRGSLPFPRTLLGRDPSTTVAELLEIVEGWAADVWPTLGAVAMPVVTKDAAEKRSLMARLPMDDFLTTATRGVRWPALPADVKLTLAPSYVARPWVTHIQADDEMVVVYPVSDASLGTPSDLATRRLARLSAALRGTHRRRVVSQLTERTQSLNELAAALEVDSTELLRDLLNLRSAGMVTIDAETHRYELHPETLPDLGQLLYAYLDAVERETERPMRTLPAPPALRRST